MAQVRLEADIADALRVEAETLGVSVAQLANRRLRDALGLNRGKVAERRTATVSSPITNTIACSHPITRRIGNACALCGSHMKGTPR